MKTISLLTTFCALITAYLPSTAMAEDARFVLEKNPDIGQMQQFKTSDLCTVANNTNAYFESQKNSPENTKTALQPGSLITADISLQKVEATLSFLCEVYISDVRNKRQSRLQDADFLKNNFDFYRWYPDKDTALAITKKSTNAAKNRLLTQIPNDQLFITKYYTKLLKASPIKTTQYNHALYALPYDEVGLNQEQAEQQKSTLTRYKYTRQQIINGVIADHNLAKPLVWISEEGLHDVLLQGTGVLEVNGKTRYFNVHRNNGVKYDYSIGKSAQGRYWYFAEVPSIMGYGDEIENKIAIKPHVTFAGNVDQFGIGKLIMINYPLNGQSSSQMGILADTGGAFDNNRFQLDMLVDSYYGWTDYHQANKHLPDYANTWIMLLKD